jgi:hypothetical protein
MAKMKNSTPPISHIARGVCVRQISVSCVSILAPAALGDVDLLVFLTFFRARSDVASSVFDPFRR